MDEYYRRKSIAESIDNAAICFGACLLMFFIGLLISLIR